MRTTSLSGKTHSVYISVCLNGSATFKHPYFLAKGAVQSNKKNRPSQQQQCKGMANFLDLQINLSLFYFSFRYLCVNQKPKTLCTNQFYAPLPLVRSL